MCGGVRLTLGRVAGVDDRAVFSSQRGWRGSVEAGGLVLKPRPIADLLEVAVAELRQPARGNSRQAVGPARHPFFPVAVAACDVAKPDQDSQQQQVTLQAEFTPPVVHGVTRLFEIRGQHPGSSASHHYSVLSSCIRSRYPANGNSRKTLFHSCSPPPRLLFSFLQR